MKWTFSPCGGPQRQGHVLFWWTKEGREKRRSLGACAKLAVSEAVLLLGFVGNPFTYVRPWNTPKTHLGGDLPSGIQSQEIIQSCFALIILDTSQLLHHEAASSHFQRSFRCSGDGIQFDHMLKLWNRLWSTQNPTEISKSNSAHQVQCLQCTSRAVYESPGLRG